jgi:hypothetical protein
VPQNQVVIFEKNKCHTYYSDKIIQADVAIGEGAHFATSDQPFGIIQVGYTNATSYGYPGGMRLAVLNPG